MQNLKIAAAVCAVALSVTFILTTGAAAASGGSSSSGASAGTKSGVSGSVSQKNSSGSAASDSKASSGGAASGTTSGASGSGAANNSGASSPSGNSGTQNGQSPSAQSSPQPNIDVKGKAEVMAEASTGTVLYEVNAHQKLYPASITKIMTELLVLEAIESGKIAWDDKVTASAHASSMGGSDIWLEPGEVMSVNDLFKAMAVSSANDAAVALAEKVAGSEQAFVAMMNEKAKTLGMNDTQFVNCTGLDDTDANVTSAYDVMLMSRELVRHKNIFNYCSIWMDTLRGGKTNLYNTNKLIHSYDGCNGLKTGSTGKAGWCLSATALRDGMQVIAVVMDCPTAADRFASAAHMLDYAFANYSVVQPKLAADKVPVSVLHGDQEKISAVADSQPSVLVQKGKEKSIQQKVSLVPNVMAPVVKDQVLGEITFWVDGKSVGSVSLKAAASVGRLTFARAFGKLFVRFF